MNFLKTVSIIIVCCFFTTVNAQRHTSEKKLKSTEKITKELAFSSNSSKNLFVVENVYGSIEVEGYNGKTIQIEVTKTIYANTNSELAIGKKEIGIKTAEKDNIMYLYLDSPSSHFNLETGDFQHRENYSHNGRNYRNKRNYRYALDFKIKIPKHTSIDLNAINNGDIFVRNVHGKLLVVSNINGAITLKNVSGKTDVNALNKDISITYAKNPSEESWYRSLNGDINIKFKDNLDATISYRTMNGDFYTNFDVFKTVPKIIKNEERRSKGVKYKISSNGHFKIGNGGVQLHFDQLNGNAIVKK